MYIEQRVNLSIDEIENVNKMISNFVCGTVLSADEYEKYYHMLRTYIDELINEAFKLGRKVQIDMERE